MNIARFLALTTQDELAYKAILDSMGEHKEETKAASPDVSDSVFNCILAIDLAVLIKIAIKYPDINALCESPRFAKHWQEMWRQSGVNPAGKFHRGDLPTQEYEPMPTASCFGLLKGFYLYKTYRFMYAGVKEWTPEVMSEARDYLEMSAQFGCFFAMNLLCERGLQLLEAKPDESLAGEIHNLAQKAADLYWTPGYLLLSYVNQEMSRYAEALLPDTQLLPKIILFREAWVALKVAQKLEKDSHAMLNNAYQGKTIEEATKGKIRSWLQANVRLKDLSNGFMDDVMERDVEIEATKIAQRIKAKYPKAFKVIEPSKTISTEEFKGEGSNKIPKSDSEPSTSLRRYYF